MLGDIITIISPPHNASQYCLKMAEVFFFFVANGRQGETFPDNHFTLHTTVPGGDVLLKCFVMAASTVSGNTCVYPLRGRRGGEGGCGGGGWLFALKMGALSPVDTTHMSDAAGRQASLSGDNYW